MIIPTITARRPRAADRQPAGQPPPVRAMTDAPVYPLFLRTAILLAMTLGFTLGATLLWTRVFGMPGGWGFAWWYPHTQMHGMVQVFGFIGLFIMGVGLHVVPRLMGVTPPARRAALAIYGTVLGGLTLRVVAHIPGEWLGAAGLDGLLGMAGGVLLLAGSAMFAGAVLNAMWRSGRPATPQTRYFAAAAVWLTLGAAGQFAQAVYLAATGQSLVPDAFNEPVLHVLLVGFAAMFTLAISLQVLPMFLNLAPPSREKVVAAFWLINAGLAVRVVGSGGGALLDAPILDAVARLAVPVEAAGLIMIAAALAPWRVPRFPPGYPGGYGGYAKFLKTAYVWLVVAGLLEAGLALRALAGTAPSYVEVSAARHALALGFLTLMVMGAALRMLPMFGGTLLAWPRLADAAFWLVLASVGLRVPFSLVGGPWPELAATLTGASGVLGAVGLACWSAAVWRTLDART